MVLGAAQRCSPLAHCLHHLCARGQAELESGLVKEQTARPFRQAPSIPQRFHSSYEVDAVGCWVWQKYLQRGYGIFYPTSDDRWLAHRWSFTQSRGPIPEGLELDHLCRNRACVNPDHLEPVTGAENTRRGVLARPTCKYGHDKADQYITSRRDGRIDRHCRPCQQARTAAYRKRKREEVRRGE